MPSPLLSVYRLIVQPSSPGSFVCLMPSPLRSFHFKPEIEPSTATPALSPRLPLLPPTSPPIHPPAGGLGIGVPAAGVPWIDVAKLPPLKPAAPKVGGEAVG